MVIQINTNGVDYGVGFVSRSLFSLPNFDCGKTFIIFGFDMWSSVHIGNKKKDNKNNYQKLIHDVGKTK